MPSARRSVRTSPRSRLAAPSTRSKVSNRTDAVVGLGHQKLPWTERAQGVGSIAAAGIAAIAAGLSAIALIIQVQTNNRQAEAIQDQISLNQQAREDRLVRYASLVSWWLEYETGTVRAQNRSVVPVRNAHLGYKLTLFNPIPIGGGEELFERTFYFRIPTLPPCTILAFKPEENAPDWQALPRVSPIILDKLWFADVNGDWAVTSGGKPEPSPPMVTDEGLALGIGAVGGASKKVEPASDCG